MNILIVVHKAEEGGYWGEIPALEGCFVQAETIDDLLVEAQSAAASHLDALRDDGQPVPDLDDVFIASVRLPEASVA
jgi:predicted RNase H-like HicB family nuclease